MKIQRLRNLTTGRLHTDMLDIYQDLERITGIDGLYTHMLPRALDAATPWLKDKVSDERFWDGKYDVTHIGDFDLPEPTIEEKGDIQRRFRGLL